MYVCIVSIKLLGDQAIFMKGIYILGNIAALAFALYKFNSMGLLPTHQSDWLEFLEPQKVYNSLPYMLHFTSNFKFPQYRI